MTTIRIRNRIRIGIRIRIRIRVRIMIMIIIMMIPLDRGLDKQGVAIPSLVILFYCFLSFLLEGEGCGHPSPSSREARGGKRSSSLLLLLLILEALESKGIPTC